MEAGSATARGRMGWRLWAVVPVLLLAIAVGLVVTSGSSLVDLVGTNPPPADEFDIRRVEFSPGEIRITVRNPQPDDLTIANVNVDDAIVPFTVDGPTTLGRLRSSTIVVPFDWVEEDPITVGVTSSTGIETVQEIPAAIETPEPALEGIPRLRDHRHARRRAPGRARPALAAGAASGEPGLARRLHGADRRPAHVPRRRGADRGLRAAGGAAVGARRQRPRPARGRAQLPRHDRALRPPEQGRAATGFALALLVAIGIGVHNLGEGLAIGASFALGELQLGTFLIVGFMIHNITEGLGIAAPVAKSRVTVLALAMLALIAGAPAILGAWIGGYTSSDVLGVLFFAIAAGAALQVVVEVGRYVAREAPGGLRSGYAIGGFLAGIAAMYVTGVFVG